MKHDYTFPETPEQNGVADRYNRANSETGRSNRIKLKLASSSWLKFVDTAAYVRNLVQKDKSKKSP